MNGIAEPCLCGDPECQKCFPQQEDEPEYDKYQDEGWGKDDLIETLRDIGSWK